MVYNLGTVPVLNYLVDAVPLDGAPEKIRAVDQTPDGGVGFDSMYGGRTARAEHFPTRIEWRGPPGSIGDIDGNNLRTVSARARDFVERFEPGVHQFIPVDFVDRDGNLMEQRFHWVVGNRIDSVDREHTTSILLAGKMWRPIADVVRAFPQYLPPGTDTSAESTMVFSRAQIGGAHVWRDKHIDTGAPFISDEFYRALLDSDLTGFDRQSRYREHADDARRAA